jgi:hypothetical protein
LLEKTILVPSGDQLGLKAGRRPGETLGGARSQILHEDLGVEAANLALEDDLLAIG